jgi:hypothetical protein
MQMTPRPSQAPMVMAALNSDDDRRNIDVH